MIAWALPDTDGMAVTGNACANTDAHACSLSNLIDRQSRQHLPCPPLPRFADRHNARNARL